MSPMEDGDRLWHADPRTHPGAFLSAWTQLWHWVVDHAADGPRTRWIVSQQDRLAASQEALDWLAVFVLHRLAALPDALHWSRAAYFRSLIAHLQEILPDTVFVQADRLDALDALFREQWASAPALAEVPPAPASHWWWHTHRPPPTGHTSSS